MRSSGYVGLWVVLLAGCSASHTGGEGPACGPVRCASDQVCCNASCGICTAPSEGCVAIACVLDGGAAPDAGPSSCGGIAGRECPPGFFCDYPGRGCGGDDSLGACRPRPDGCAEPGGVAVCGCDGRDYIGECSANLAGVDVAFVGSCSASPAGSVAAWRECGPADGPAWRIEISESARASCDARPPGTLVIDVWEELEGTAPRTLSIGGGIANGQASWCPSEGGPCSVVTGTLVVDVFVTGELARFDAQMLLADGTRIAFTDVELTSSWCGLVLPGCG